MMKTHTKTLRPQTTSGKPQTSIISYTSREMTTIEVNGNLVSGLRPVPS